jgi:uncharacterized protein (TIGR00369 family)
LTKQPDPHPFSLGSFSEFLGIEEVKAGEGWAHVRMPIRKQYLEEGDSVHGGIIMTLADTAFWRAVVPLLSHGQTAVTSDLKVNFTRPARGDHLFSESRVIHKGNRLVVGEADVTDSEGNLVAKALGTYVILEPR